MKIRMETLWDRRGQMLFKVQLEQTDKVEVKTLDYASFISLMSGSASNEMYISLGKIPSGYVDADFAGQDTFKVFLQSPAQKRLMIFDKGHYWIPFPGCLFFLDIYHGSLKELFLYTFTDAEIREDTKLYHYPFGNVSETGRVCMGNIYFHDMVFGDAGKVVEAFFLGKTSSDYYNSRNVGSDYTLLQLIHKLEGKKVFPKRWLAGYTGMTYAMLKKNKL